MRTLLSSIVLSLLLGGFLTACDSNPVEDDHDDAAAEVEGLRLIANGVTRVTYTDGDTSDSLFVATGDETSLITVAFLDDDGDAVHADEFDDEFSLGYDIADENVVAFEQHAEDGRWRFHLVGLQAGSTTIDLHLLHVDHKDFTAFNIPVIVTEAE